MLDPNTSQAPESPIYLIQNIFCPHNIVMIFWSLDEWSLDNQCPTVHFNNNFLAVSNKSNQKIQTAC